MHYTDTFEVLHINHITILPEAIQVNVDYVEGSVHNMFYAKLQCPFRNISNTFNGFSGMIDGVPPNELCTLMVTDANAMTFINTRVPFTIENITVPIATVIPYTNTPSTTMNQATPTEGLLSDFSSILCHATSNFLHYRYIPTDCFYYWSWYRCWYWYLYRCCCCSSPYDNL